MQEGTLTLEAVGEVMAEHWPPPEGTSHAQQSDFDHEETSQLHM